MQSAMTKFNWSGGIRRRFQRDLRRLVRKSPPTAGSYNDGISGFIMVWLYKPGSRQPIGSVARTASIAGIPWDVWVGPRDRPSPGTDRRSRPVIS